MQWMYSLEFMCLLLQKNDNLEKEAANISHIFEWICAPERFEFFRLRNRALSANHCAELVPVTSDASVQQNCRPCPDHLSGTPTAALKAETNLDENSILSSVLAPNYALQSTTFFLNQEFLQGMPSAQLQLGCLWHVMGFDWLFQVPGGLPHRQPARRQPLWTSASGHRGRVD
jgi:hypothetical protein